MSDSKNREAQVGELMKAAHENNSDEVLRLGAGLLGEFLQDVKDIADTLDEVGAELCHIHNAVAEIKRGG